MMALKCLRSTKNALKSKPFWLANIETSTNHTMFLSVTHQLIHGRHFCTHTVSSVEEFTVRRSELELVGPAEPTPRELKPLSVLDDQRFLRMLTPIVQFYRYDPSMEGKDPARIIRDAVARALVFYYPLAGRLREGPDERLSVDCTGEGVLFVEAEVDVELSRLGVPPRPPFPWIEEFLYYVPVLGGTVDSPLLIIQVTRLKCGGFVLALRFNHTMNDGGGLVQFLTAVAEIARGAHTPSITPIWSRELFGAPNTRQVTITNHENKKMKPHPTVNPLKNPDLIQRSFFFRPSNFSTIRALLPRATMFEILTAFLWRCRTRTLRLDDPEDTVRLIFPINARDKTNTNRVVPIGYYGNASWAATSDANVRELCDGPMEYAVGLVRRAKEECVKEYMSWGAGGPVIRARPPLAWEKCLFVTDLRRLGLGDVDFGWGKAAYAGFARIEIEGAASYVWFRDRDGEDGILVTICLEVEDMGRFETELNNMLSHG